MAQVTNGNMQVNKPIENHSWSIKELTRNDVLAVNQWPFKVVRDEGKQTKMEIRSITDLNKSFEGTKYNLIQCPNVKSRYSLLYNEFKKRSNEIQNITHLLITYDTVYYMVNKEVRKADGNVTSVPEFKSFTFGTNLFNEDDIDRVVNGILLSSGYFDSLIKDNFMNFTDMYKQAQVEAKRMKVKDSDFRGYIKRTAEYNNFGKTVSFVLKNRQKIKTIDNVKPLIDILDSDLNFSNLMYLYFTPYPNHALDYSKVIKQRLVGNPYNIDYRNYPNIIEEFKKVPSVKSEESSFISFLDNLKVKKEHRTIRKGFLLYYDNTDSKIMADNIYKLFKDATNSKNIVEPIYISDAERTRMENMDKNKQDTQEVLNKVNNLQREIRGTYAEVLDMLVVMNSMMRMADTIHQKGVEINNVEYNIWINQYNVSTIKGKIESVYTYRRTKKENESDKGVVIELYPISKVFRFIQEKIGSANSVDLNTELSYFTTNIVPTYFKNDNLGLENLNIDKVDSKDPKEIVENLQNLKNIIKNIKSNFMFLFEVFLGVQYATFGVFMKRYGIGGLSMTKMLISDLVNKYSGRPFNLTKMVNHNANLAFYTVQLGLDSLEHYNSDTVASASDEYGIGDFAYFVKKYLESICGMEIPELVHNDSQDKRYSNLMQVAFSVVDILDTCENLVHLDITNDENRKKMVEALKKDIDTETVG